MGVWGALVGPVVEGTLGVLGSSAGPVFDVGAGIWLEHEEKAMSAPWATQEVE